MSDAINLVEILATLYLLAIIGALAYAAARAWWTKWGSLHSFSTQPHRRHPAPAGTHRH